QRAKDEPRHCRGVKHQHWHARRRINIRALQLLCVSSDGRDSRLFQRNSSGGSVHGLVAGLAKAAAGGGDCAATEGDAAVWPGGDADPLGPGGDGEPAGWLPPGFEAADAGDAAGLVAPAGDACAGGGVAIGPAPTGFFCARSATVSSMARLIGMRTTPLFLSTQA